MLSSKFSASFLRPNPTGQMWQSYLKRAILQAAPVLISKQSISPSAKRRDSQKAFCIRVAAFCRRLYSIRTEVSTGNSCSSIALPTSRSRTSCLTSTGAFPKIPPSCRRPGSMHLLLPTFFFFCVLSPVMDAAKISAPVMWVVLLVSD